MTLPIEIIAASAGSGKTYTLEVTLTVYPHTDEHLQNEQAIRDEVESWLASLDATVDEISVQRRKGEQ